MDLKTAESKIVANDLITFTDELNDKGEKVRRTTVIKKHFLAVNSFRQKLQKEIKLSFDDGETMTLADYIKNLSEYKHKIPTQEVYSGEPIDLNANEKKMLKYYFDDREELLPMSEECFKAFSEL